MEPQNITSRKYFLDWLRVIAFGLLILFHTGCLYASWTYNLKSPRLLPELEWFLLDLSPWRMALLFLISGVAARTLVDRIGAGGFAVDRVRRLVPVLLVGMFVVIPPQTYIQLVDRGLTHDSYWHFWIFSYLAADQTLVAPLHKTMPTYDHLWFLAYLLAYALLFALVMAVVRLAGRGRPAGPARLPIWLTLVAPGLWLVLTTFIMERIWPQTFWIGNDWGSHLKWAGMFAIGAVLARHEAVWPWLQRHRLALLVTAAVCLTLQSINRAYYLTGQADPLWSAIGWSVTSGAYAWAMICALCGCAAAWFKRPGPVLTHLNEAILPVYVLHQPILLIAAWFIFPRHWPLPMEITALVAITALGSLSIYEGLIRPFAVTRFLFGLRAKRPLDG